jgi:hypothetical protein
MTGELHELTPQFCFAEQQDQQAASSLVAANKNLDRDTKSEPSSAPQSQPQPQPQLQRKAGTPAVESRTATPVGRFDKLGRRMFTPPLSRTNSSQLTPSSSIPGTPRREEDGDIDRASTLLSLYEIRAKLKEQDNSSLMRAREKINALAARQAHLGKEQKTSASQQKAQQKDTTGSSRISYPK